MKSRNTSGSCPNQPLAFICCSGISFGNDSVWRIMAKSNPVVERRGERCCLSKGSPLQGMASEQSRLLNFRYAEAPKVHSDHGEKVERQRAAMKSDLKCSKPWIEGFFGWLVYVKWPDVLKEHWKIGKLGDHHHTQEDMSDAPTTGAYLS